MISGADPASEKGGVAIEKVRMRFATLESGELHNIWVFCNIVIKLLYCEVSVL